MVCFFVDMCWAPGKSSELLHEGSSQLLHILFLDLRGVQSIEVGGRDYGSPYVYPLRKRDQGALA